MDKIIIKKWALQNALAYGGKANPGAVIGKVIAEHPEAKERIAEIAKEIQQIVREINKLSAEQQKKELESLAPELLEKKEKEEHELKPLPDAEMGKVILRLAPEPSKYLHIGHALVFMIQYLYAKRYKGRCYLRIEDTNPEKSKKEFYDSIIEDLRWLGIKYAKEIIVSDEMPLFYDSAEKLISAKDAYVCKCAQEEMKKLREEKQPCHCRNNPDSLGTSMKEWKAMLSGKFRPGERTLRLAGDMENQNGTLRDPVIFRISDTPHYRQKK
ncbi:glutamate--tRNA ligase, partial [Candidatus Woesearchaeota archaeon]|nr:glutamate--tRNA ligase [Candidatus Woesearchaeota archaeon]